MGRQQMKWTSGIGGGRKAVDSLDDRRRDEAKPTHGAKPLPCWDTRLRYMLRSKTTQIVPHQWTTATGKPRCVRCGWPLDHLLHMPTWRGRVIPTCDAADCKAGVKQELACLP